MRDFPLINVHGKAMAAAEAAECSEDKYFDMVDKLYSKMDEWQNSEDLWTLFNTYAKEIGVDKNSFETCISDKESVDAEIQNDISDGEAYLVQGVPTFFINGRKLVGAVPYEEFEKILEEELEIINQK
jgi:protein-disulfide isomerase